MISPSRQKPGHRYLNRHLLRGSLSLPSPFPRFRYLKIVHITLQASQSCERQERHMKWTLGAKKCSLGSQRMELPGHQASGSFGGSGNLNQPEKAHTHNERGGHRPKCYFHPCLIHQHTGQDGPDGARNRPGPSSPAPTIITSPRIRALRSRNTALYS